MSIQEIENAEFLAGDEFDLDVRIVVRDDLPVHEAGFSCSWYTCGQCGFPSYPHTQAVACTC
ncbi:FDLD family class I lanthipeptide [Nonomuraea sp. NPDC050451]|uniref:FDLD family class I lanthipeptide n=1 Tax=Nonomuraea sp. NPDC050451 TaxID=3364364 RepID=UPI003796F68B